MKTEDDMMDLLRHYRHDWMNELQLLTGYASMGKLEKVKEKLHDNIKAAEQERMLSNLGLPKTALWIISFNWRYSHFRLDYFIECKGSFTEAEDDKIKSRCVIFVETLESYSSKMELYKGSFVLRQGKSSTASVEIELSFSGEFKNVTELKKVLNEKLDLPVFVHPTIEEKNKCTILIDVHPKR